MSAGGEPRVRVGLEVHASIETRSKLHCPCPVDASAEPNTLICPTCTGQPGAKPQRIDRVAVEHVVTIARLLDCTLDATATMQRKHYSYPDLPNNYQRTSTPFGRNGSFDGVGIIEAHLEEDPGAYDPATGTVDLNRCGSPLCEIVTAPDLASADEVVRFLRTLRVGLEINGLLRRGAELKADVNVSVGDGPRVEVKNVTGARNAARAVEFEAQRQRRLVADGQDVAFETRHFDEATGMTRPSRGKETVSEYRYIPDPDLGPLDLRDVADRVDEPQDVVARLGSAEERFRADRDEVLAVAEDPPLLDALEALADEAEPERVFDFVNRVVRGELNYRDRRYGEPLTVEGLRRVIRARTSDELTRRSATNVVRAWLDGTPLDDALEDALGVVADDALVGVVGDVLGSHAEAVADYRAGKGSAIDFLLGQVMARTRGKADPQAARRILERELEPE